MTRFGPRIEPITSPTPGECATCYATDAGIDTTIQQQQCSISIEHTIYAVQKKVSCQNAIQNLKSGCNQLKLKYVTFKFEYLKYTRCRMYSGFVWVRLNLNNNKIKQVRTSSFLKKNDLTMEICSHFSTTQNNASDNKDEIEIHEMN